MANKQKEKELSTLPIGDNPETFGTGDVPFDPDRYRSEISDMELSEEQANEFLEILWNMMIQIMDLGFNVDSVQLACGQVAERSASPAVPDADALQSTSTPQHNEQDASGLSVDSAQKGFE